MRMPTSSQSLIHGLSSVLTSQLSTCFLLCKFTFNLFHLLSLNLKILVLNKAPTKTEAIVDLILTSFRKS